MSLDPVVKRTKVATGEINPPGKKMLPEEMTQVIPTSPVVVTTPLPLSPMLVSSLGNANLDGLRLRKEDMMSPVKLWLTLFTSQTNLNVGKRNLRS